MLTFACLCILTVLQQTATARQTPNLTRCRTDDDTIVQIQDIYISNTTLGDRLQLDATFNVFKAYGSSPVLEIFVNTSSGTPLHCVHSTLPKELRLCYGKTVTEGMLNRAWKNRCPVKPGKYIAHVSLQLPDAVNARSCLEDGELLTTIRIKDEGYIFDCVTFPVTIALFPPDSVY